MKLATIVVTYYPTRKVLDNISSYSNNSDILYIWDNTPGGSSLIQNSYIGTLLNHSHENRGLASAYNEAIRHCQTLGCSHLMTMDQDSMFEGFSNYKKQIESFTDPAVGIFTLPINNDITRNDYRETTVCQSGSVYVLDMINNIGGFREDFFIGMVDAEMSLRALEKGYKIFQLTGCNLIQHIGAERMVNFLGRRIEVSDYSPLRHYYDSRNRILMWHEFPNDCTTRNKLKYLWSRFKLIVKIFLFEKQKWAKTFAIVRGTVNGLLNKTKPF